MTKRQVEKSKRCSKCKTWKAERMFYKNREKKDGLCTWCKECMDKYRKSFLNPYAYQKKSRDQNIQMKTKEQIQKRLTEEQKKSDVLLKHLMDVDCSRKVLHQYCAQESKVELLKWVLSV